ncbi:hypoxanthine phosphoribosyltransferase [Convivina intestini]|uniref:Hypoxanthine phosphoribosyltransferase n=1 Tax=Convivina intestini TaxID=1505726 RepID=A0A2U1DF45_9LACO|nr:hypoxanthine phosphoribosyltransferase [Convivina intestini]PVY86301.1 hypoxanthine phosphoribosyltransferase [Convivina intestini]CAH1850961.1 Hypoxanthine-guanine phosphoribosyltransferase [Convivina intestini]SDB82308.1 hypoxanthine phosphoribosyltransferase [Leuconostocaceae bacterium R-53105]
MRSLINHPAIKGVLATETDIQAQVQRVANELTEEFADHKQRPVFIAVLKGGVIFATDLLRKMPLDVDFDFIDVKSYSGDSSTGQVKVVHDVSMDLTGRDVVVVDEIIDSGRTMQWLNDYFELKGAASVTTVALADKKAARVVDFEVDYAGLEVPDEFLVGYGMDYNNSFRNLPVIAVVDLDKIDLI